MNNLISFDTFTQHVFGLGSLWETYDIAKKTCTRFCNNRKAEYEYEYLGLNGIRVWTEDWKCTTDAPAIVGDGSQGTTVYHFSEACMQDEVIVIWCLSFIEMI